MQNLILLHGAIGSSEQLQPLAQRLSAAYNVHLLDFSGHGGRAFPADLFSIKIFAEETLQFIEQQKLDKVSIFGYSMGGYVAMYLARYYPAKVDRLITLATKFHWDPSIAAKELQMINAEKLAAKLPNFAETLSKRHAPNDWKEVLSKTGNMLEAMGNDNPLKPDDYKQIFTPCLVLLGDRDKMITLEETMEVYKSLAGGQMGMLPSTPHPVEQVNMDALIGMIKPFLG